MALTFDLVFHVHIWFQMVKYSSQNQCDHIPNLIFRTPKLKLLVYKITPITPITVFSIVVNEKKQSCGNLDLD